MVPLSRARFLIGAAGNQLLTFRPVYATHPLVRLLALSRYVRVFLSHPYGA